MAKVKYKVEFLKSEVDRKAQTFHADMVQIDPAHTKFYESGVNHKGQSNMQLVASFPSHIIEAVTKVGK